MYISIVRKPAFFDTLLRSIISNIIPMPIKKKPTQKPSSSKSKARKFKKDKQSNKKKPKSKKLFKKKKVIRNIQKKKTAGKKENKASKKITLHLGKKNVKFDVIEHRKVYTAYDLAQTLGAKLDDIAKTLLIEVEIPEFGKKKKGHYVVVVPASYRLNLKKVKKALKATKVGIATEKAMLKMGMEPGALTPFGSTRDLRVIVDKNLFRAKKILVGAESFVESLRLTTKDLVKTEDAIVCLVGDKSKLKLQSKAKPKKKPKKGKKSAAKKTVKKPVAKKKGVKKSDRKIGRKAAKKSIAKKSVRKTVKKRR